MSKRTAEGAEVRNPWPRAFFVVASLAILVSGAAFAGRWVPDSAAGSPDFVDYRAAARLLLTGENPYDPSKLLPLQKEVGWPFDKADMIWNPPWVFPIVLPTGWLSWSCGLLAWGALQLAVVVLSAVMIWRTYGGAGWRILVGGGGALG